LYTRISALHKELAIAAMTVYDSAVAIPPPPLVIVFGDGVVLETQKSKAAIRVYHSLVLVAVAVPPALVPVVMKCV
jgi:hypothetical protein